jgi:hypothetical protein
VTTCRFVASDHPRVLPQRHQDECADDECAGCLPCPLDHCRVCGVEHDRACGGCLNEARDNLDEIQELYDDLPWDAITRGVNGEAAALLGPAADPEAWGHVTASMATGRIPADWRLLPGDKPELTDDERHPLWVFGTWAMVYRDAFDHDEPVSRATVASEAGYLARNLTYMGDFEWVPFEDFARDLRGCVGHLKAVRHDQDHGVRANIPCFDCGADLERRLGLKGFDDAWTCRGRGCGRRYTIAEYNFALRAALEESA